MKKINLLVLFALQLVTWCSCHGVKGGSYGGSFSASSASAQASSSSSSFSGTFGAGGLNSIDSGAYNHPGAAASANAGAGSGAYHATSGIPGSGANYNSGPAINGGYHSNPGSGSHNAAGAIGTSGCCNGPFPGPSGSIHDSKPAPPGGGGPPINAGASSGSYGHVGTTLPVPSAGHGGATGISGSVIGSLPGPSGSIHSSKPVGAYGGSTSGSYGGEVSGPGITAGLIGALPGAPGDIHTSKPSGGSYGGSGGSSYPSTIPSGSYGHSVIGTSPSGNNNAGSENYGGVNLGSVGSGLPGIYGGAGATSTSTGYHNVPTASNIPSASPGGNYGGPSSSTNNYHTPSAGSGTILSPNHPTTSSSGSYGGAGAVSTGGIQQVYPSTTGSGGSHPNYNKPSTGAVPVSTYPVSTPGQNNYAGASAGATSNSEPQGTYTSKPIVPPTTEHVYHIKPVVEDANYKPISTPVGSGSGFPHGQGSTDHNKSPGGGYVPVVVGAGPTIVGPICNYKNAKGGCSGGAPSYGSSPSTGLEAPHPGSNNPTYGGEKTNSGDCCKGPFPGPTGSIHDSKPASAVAPLPLGNPPSHLPGGSGYVTTSIGIQNTPGGAYHPIPKLTTSYDKATDLIYVHNNNEYHGPSTTNSVGSPGGEIVFDGAYNKPSGGPYNNQPASGCAGGSCSGNSGSYATGGAQVPNKPDRSVTPQGNYQNTGCSGGACGGHSGSYGFATGDVQVQKPDGSITHGNDYNSQNPGCSGGSCGGGSPGSGSYHGSGIPGANSGSYGHSGSGGFATGDVEVHKPDGSVSHPHGNSGSGCSGGSCGGGNSGSGSYGGSSIPGTNSGSYGSSGSGGGFATGDVEVHKPDGSVSHPHGGNSGSGGCSGGSCGGGANSGSYGGGHSGVKGGHPGSYGGHGAYGGGNSGAFAGAGAFGGAFSGSSSFASASASASSSSSSRHYLIN